MAVESRNPHMITQGELLTASNADVGAAVPTGRRFIPRRIRLHNSDTTDRTVTLYVIPTGQSAGAAYYLLQDEPVPAKTTIIVPYPEGESWYAGTKLQGSASTASVVNIVVGGLLVQGSFN